MPVSRSRKGNEDEQVCNRISRFGLLQRSVSDPGAKTVSSRGPRSQAAFQIGSARVSPWVLWPWNLPVLLPPPSPRTVDSSMISLPRPSSPAAPRLPCGWHIWPFCFASTSVISAAIMSLPPGLATPSHTAQSLMARLSLTLLWRKRN